MRYQEIINELSFPDTKNRASAILQSAGYELAGRGSRGDVWMKNGVKGVLKLFNASDNGYMKFIELVNTHPNEHFPIFYSKPVRISNLYYAIRMEKLESVDSWDSIYLPGALEIIKYFDYGKETPEVMNIFSEQPGLKDACDLAKGLINDHISNDLIASNIMRRAGVYVIIDPVSG